MIMNEKRKRILTPEQKAEKREKARLKLASMSDAERAEYKAKRTERARQRYQQNPEAGRAAAKRFRQTHPERAAEQMRKWTEKNQESLKARWAARRKNEPQKVKQAQQKWKAANKPRLKAYESKRCREQAEIFRAKASRRRALKRGNGGTHTAADVRDILRKQKGRCAACQCETAAKYHVDHVIPLSKGGDNSRFNLQILCPPCNLRKHDKDPITFMQEMGMLL